MVERITISRRGLVQTAGVMLGAGMAGIPATALASTADPDAGLVALIARHGEALAALEVADAAAEPLRRLHEATAPAAPEALQWRLADFPHTSFGRGASDAIGDTGAREYHLRGVEWLRKTKPAGHWPAASEARRCEIVEAHDAWMAERQVQADRIGLRAANDACDRASDLVAKIEIAICGYVPTTLSGFQAKARWIASSPQADEWAEFLLRDLCGVTS